MRADARPSYGVRMTPLETTGPLQEYDLEEPVAVGAHGRVYRGLHRASGTPVAVKLLTDSTRGFEQEAAAIARMDHPNIVPILDLGRATWDGTEHAFLVMPWAAQGTLVGAQGIEVVSIARQLLEALGHAHARGVVHQDLKPANVLLREGDAWLSDFSIARLDGASERRARGTPRYMAPEQFTGVGVGPWTDRYGLGCLLYELLAGRSPFEANSHAAWARVHAEQVAPPLPPHVPERLAIVVQRLLSKAPMDRFASDREAWSALQGGTPAVVASTVDASATVTTSSALQFEAVPGIRGASGTLAPMPDWRTAAHPVAGRETFTGRSVALLRLRSTATVGRGALRDRLWSELRSTWSSGHARAVILTGPPGAGLSHLAKWVCIHAVEHGVAVEVPLGQEPPPGSLGVTVVDDATRVEQRRVLAALAAPDRPAVLYVLVCREERLPAFEAFDVPVLEVGPLSREEHAQLLALLSPIDSITGAALYAHAAGLPEPTVRLAAQLLRGGGTLRRDGWTVGLEGDELRALTVLACFDGPAPLEDWERGCAVVGIPDARSMLPALHDQVRQVRGSLLPVDPERKQSMLHDASSLMADLAEAGVGDRRERARWWILAGEGLRGARLALDLCEERSRSQAAQIRPLFSLAAEGLAQVHPAPETDLRRLAFVRLSQVATSRNPQAIEEAFSGPDVNWLSPLELELLQAWPAVETGGASRLLEVVGRLLEGPLRPFVEVKVCYFGAYGAAHEGDVPTMERLFARGAAVASEAGLVELSVACLCDRAGWAGRLQLSEVCEAYASAALEAAERHGLMELAAFARINLGEALKDRGELELAEAQFVHAERGLEACGSVASAHARMLRLLMKLDGEEPVRMQFTALRRLFGSFSNGAAPATHCAIAEAVCAYREHEATRGEVLAREVASRFDARPPFPEMVPLLRRLHGVASGETQRRLAIHLPVQEGA